MDRTVGTLCPRGGGGGGAAGVLLAGTERLVVRSLGAALGSLNESGARVSEMSWPGAGVDPWGGGARQGVGFGGSVGAASPLLGLWGSGQGRGRGGGGAQAGLDCAPGALQWWGQRAGRSGQRVWEWSRCCRSRLR